MNWLLASETFCSFMIGGIVFLLIDRASIRALALWQKYRGTLPK